MFASLSGFDVSGQVAALSDRVSYNTLLMVANAGTSYLKMPDGWADEFEDETGIDAAKSSGQTYVGAAYTSQADAVGYDYGISGSTALGLMTIFERGWALSAGQTVTAISVYSGAAQDVTVKIAREISSTEFDVVVSQTFAHPGGGWHECVILPYEVPASGDYRIGSYAPISTNYSSAGMARAYFNGDAGLGVASGFTADSGVVRCHKVRYASEMQLITAQFATAEPSEGRVLAIVEGGATHGTDNALHLSRDDGATWASGTVVVEATGLQFSGKTVDLISANINLGATPSGGSVRARVDASNVAQTIHGLYVDLKQ